MHKNPYKARRLGIDVQTPLNLMRSQSSQKPLSEETPDHNNNQFNLFTHHKIPKEQRVETVQALRQALLELYLSVKIRSDDEIDNYNEAMYIKEKEQMREVDGFTLVDHVKQSIEILMNMKMDGGGGMVPADYDDEYGYEEEEEGTKYELTDDDQGLRRGITIEQQDHPG